MNLAVEQNGIPIVATIARENQHDTQLLVPIINDLQNEINQLDNHYFIRTRSQLQQHLQNVVEDPQTLYRKSICPNHKKFECGKNIYYQEASNILIVHNQHAPDGGTAYQPKEGIQKFYDTK
ncbi:hypothetical protein [Candidatus Chromulinivorax destructor]|uniref:hypothetical protein n=1 Tax=Candidatus Chromulinivorax destructor TaxID=2066483 RepID=UPI0013B3C10C|nr:hypothetical protein [Candidatus Chromulinivorax destructor]